MNYDARIEQDEMASMAADTGQGADPLDPSGDDEDSRANRLSARPFR